MRRAAVVAIAAIGLLASACSREDRHRDTQIGAPHGGSAPAIAAPAPAAPSSTFDAETVFDALDAAASAPPPVAVVTPPTTPAPVASAPRAPSENPDDAILERARGSAGRCFATLAGPPFGPPRHEAHIDVTVIPTGRVTRAAVTSNDTTDANVLACLRRAAESTTFSDNDGGPLRTYSIDVVVTAH